MLKIRKCIDTQILNCLRYVDKDQYYLKLYKVIGLPCLRAILINKETRLISAYIIPKKYSENIRSAYNTPQTLLSQEWFSKPIDLSCLVGVKSELAKRGLLEDG